MSSLAQVLEEKYDAQQLCVVMACKRLDGAKTDMSGKVVGSAVLTADRFDGLCAAFSSALKYFDGLRTLFADVYKAWYWMTKRCKTCHSLWCLLVVFLAVHRAKAKIYL